MSASSYLKRNTLKRTPTLQKEISEILYASNVSIISKSPGKFQIDDDIKKRDALEELEIEKEIRDIFKLYDYDNSGSISKEELKKFLYSIGKPFDDKELRDLFETVDRDHNGSISVDELIFYLKTKAYYIPQTEVDEIIECFKVFDSDNDMKITKKELENILNKFDVKKVSQEDIDLFWSLCDKNGDGTVSYAEFVDMWKIR